jgi:hypothetical protein
MFTERAVDPYSNVHFDDETRSADPPQHVGLCPFNVEANELAFLDRHDAQNFVPPQLLDCIYLFEDLLTSSTWHAKWKKHAKVFEALKDLKSGAEFLATDDNPVA